jgi:excisionase family DNA binding protein
MQQELFTADEVAERLGLHVRTVRNYIRDGQLGAVRIGKQYRIARADLDAFTGRSPDPEQPVPGGRSRHVEVSSIVEIDAIDPATADRLAILLTGAANGRRDEADALHIETIYHRQRTHLKVVIVGSLTASAYVFGLINAIVEEPNT